MKYFQDQKVVVDDDNGSFAKRSAYLKLIQKKVQYRSWIQMFRKWFDERYNFECNLFCLEKKVQFFI